MAYLVLGQSNPAATTLTTLYTVPSAKSAVCSTLVVCNQAGYIATSGGAAKADARVTLTDNGLLPLPLHLDSAGANPIVFSVVATSVSGTANVAASVQWTEIR